MADETQAKSRADGPVMADAKSPKGSCQRCVADKVTKEGHGSSN